jgi:hypothetical protein
MSDYGQKAAGINQTAPGGGWLGGATSAPVALCSRPAYEYETAADIWKVARERLDAAAAAAESASREQSEAINAEQEAWIQLERLANRGTPTVQQCSPSRTR